MTPAEGLPLREPQSIDELVRRFGGELLGASAPGPITSLDIPGPHTEPETLGLAAQPRWIDAARAGQGWVLVSEQLAGRCDPAKRWVHPHPVWVFAQLLEQVVVDTTPSALPATARVAPSAVIHPGVHLGHHVIVEDHVVLFPRVRLGDGVRIGAGSVVGRGGFGYVQGPDGGLCRIAQLGGVELEAGVELGALCTIDAGTLRPTRIGTGTKLDAQVHVGHNVQIGKGCLIAAQVGFGGSVELGDSCLVGGQAGFKDHVRVGSRCQIAAQAGVIGDLPPGSTVAGFPAVPKARFFRAMARLFRGDP